VLTKIQPAHVANSDAKALARYFAATGIEIGPDRLNDGGLSLAAGMAFSGPAREATAASPDPNAASERARRHGERNVRSGRTPASIQRT
jgi:hypothetical protein